MIFILMSLEECIKMSIFNFEETFEKTLKNSDVKGYRIFYANPYTDMVECYINEKNEVYTPDHNLAEDQNRYLAMIESGALVEVDRLKLSKPLLAELGYI